MPVLTLKFKEGVLRKYRLEAKQSLSIGRLDENDIVIENLAVSGRHARIDPSGEGFLLTDLKSKNGTFVNGKPTVSHELSDGDAITIGKHTLEFDYVSVETIPEKNVPNMDETMVLDTAQHRAMMGEVAGKAAGGKPGGAEPVATAKAAAEVATLSFLSGGAGEVSLARKLVKIGKDPSSDIVAGGFFTGKTAATISQRPNGYHLSYVGGISKPKVNGQAVRESVLLKEFDMIEVGSLKMQLVFKRQ